MTSPATPDFFSPSAQEIQAFQVGQEAFPEFRTLAEDGDLSELLVRAPPVSNINVTSTAVCFAYLFLKCKVSASPVKSIE